MDEIIRTATVKDGESSKTVSLHHIIILDDIPSLKSSIFDKTIGKPISVKRIERIDDDYFSSEDPFKGERYYYRVCGETQEGSKSEIFIAVPKLKK